MEQQEASEDAVMTRIGQAIMLLHGGDREEARNRFGALWSELGADGDALHRCTLAHYMADTQDDPGDELRPERAEAVAGLLAVTSVEQHDRLADPGHDGVLGRLLLLHHCGLLRRRSSRLPSVRR